MEQTVDFLPWIHNLNDTLGLFNGSLYEVLQDDSLGSGSAEASAIGLNVTCGYLAGTNTHILREESPSWEISFESHIPPALVDSAGMYLFLQKSIINCLSGPNLIIMLGSFNNSIILYTTNDVIDSHGQKGSPVTLKEPMGPNATVSQLQFLQCSKSLITQRGTVGIPSRTLDPSSLQPSIYKTHSTWQKYKKSAVIPSDDTLIGSSIVSVFVHYISLGAELGTNITVVLFSVLGIGRLVIYPRE